MDSPRSRENGMAPSTVVVRVKQAAIVHRHAFAPELESALREGFCWWLHPGTCTSGCAFSLCWGRLDYRNRRHSIGSCLPTEEYVHAVVCMSRHPFVQK